MLKPTVIQKKHATLTLYPQDCVQGMREIVTPGSVSVVVTSPPYNLGIRYSRYDDTMARADYLRWIGEWAAVLRQSLDDKGSLFLNIGSKPTDPTVPLQVLQVLLKQEFVLQNTI